MGVHVFVNEYNVSKTKIADIANILFINLDCEWKSETKNFDLSNQFV